MAQTAGAFKWSRAALRSCRSEIRRNNCKLFAFKCYLKKYIVKILLFSVFEIKYSLEGTACLLLSPAEGFNLGQSFFFWQKKKVFMLCVLILGHFCCSVVTSVIDTSNLSYNEKNPKNGNKSKIYPKLKKKKKF